MKKQQTINFKTPRGTAKWPRLDQPHSWNDAAQKNMPDPDGQYETKVVIPEKDAQPLIKLIKETIAESGIKPKHLPFKPEIDRDTDEPTGNIEFTFKRYGKGTDGKPNRIAYFDAKGHMVKDVSLTTGSTIIVSGYIGISKMAARLNLKAIQIIKLIERQIDGFEPVDDEDAFIASEQEETANEFDNEEEANIGRPNF